MNSTLALISGLGLGLGLETSGLGLGLETPGLVNIPARCMLEMADTICGIPYRCKTTLRVHRLGPYNSLYA